MHSVNPDKLKPLAAESPGKGGPDAEWVAGLQRAPMPIDEKLFRHIGKPVERKEDQRLLTGKGRFSDDFSLPGQTYAAVVRSPHPHARILSIAKDEALACPGVLLVLTGKDCLADGLGPDPAQPGADDPLRHEARRARRRQAVRRARTISCRPTRPAIVGEAVAVVIAETAAQAADGAERVVVEYEELPFVIGSVNAAAPGAPAIWDEVPGNVFVDTRFGDWEATDAAFAKADHVVTRRIPYRPRHRGDDGAARRARRL